MLESIHKHMKWIMWVIVGLITIAFLFFGIYPSGSGRGMAATVNRDEITVEEFNRAYQNTAETYRGLLKDQFNDAFAKTLRTQVLRELITNRLLVREAERMGLRVTDQEIQATILKIPVFNLQGRFDRANYERHLDRYNLTPAMFEAQEREDLLRRKLTHIVEDSVDVTDGELAALYAAKNPKAKPGDFVKNKEKFRQTALMEKRRAALDAFVAGLLNKARVKVNDKALLR